MRSWITTWLREPLVHFLVIGALIFVVDEAVRSDDDNPRVIVIDDAVRAELVALFEDARGRPPSDREYEILVDAWLYDEVMYREAVVLGLDKGDDMFRSRLELKLRSMLLDSVVLEPATDADLRAWLEANRDRYAVPQRFDFEQFQVADADAEQTALQLASHLRNEGNNNGVVPEAYKERVRVYRNRSRDNIAAVFGTGFAHGLLNGEARTWRAVRAEGGWHVARVRAERPAIEPDFDALKAKLEADWRSFHTRRLAREAFQDIRDSYEIRREDLE